jgi:hypothetical protein
LPPSYADRFSGFSGGTFVVQDKEKEVKSRNARIFLFIATITFYVSHLGVATTSDATLHCVYRDYRTENKTPSLSG